MEIIGLSGYARSGKDEAAKVLVEEYGFTRVAFADKLRETLYALNPLVAVEVEDYEVNVGIEEEIIRGGHSEEEVYLVDVIAQFGWDGYKESYYGTEIRRLLQRMGTEVGRDILGENIWVDSTFHNLSYDSKIVITDCRFVNEAKAVLNRGGKMWRVEREGVGPVNDHPSEIGLDNWNFDVKLHNSGSLKAYHGLVRSAYQRGSGEYEAILVGGNNARGI